MNILYVTDAWHGFRECIFEGGKELSGLPSFGLVLKELIDRGHLVDFSIIQNRYPDCTLNIGVDWIHADSVKNIVYNNRAGFLGKLRAYSRYFGRTLQLLRSKKYDFVYAHGTTTGFALIFARIFGIPFGQRLYGTFLWDKYSRSHNPFILFRHFSEYFSLSTKKNFVVMTNDGSKGNLLHDRIVGKRKPYDFHFLTNGVDRMDISAVGNSEPHPEMPFIFYPARIDEWKRQDKVLRIVKLLKDNGLRLHCYFAGAVETNNESYFVRLKESVKADGTEELIHFMGNIDRSRIARMHGSALATLSLYDVCNFTNVFHETLASGAVAIVRSDGVVDDVIVDGRNGFLVKDDEEEICAIIKSLVGQDSSAMRRNAIETSRAYIRPWKERIDFEIGLIEKAVRGGVSL